MNEVLNTQGYAVAGRRNRIPVAAWVLMGLIAIACNVLPGAGTLRPRARALLILPLVLSFSFFHIADIAIARVEA